jgi:hypothetical protein
LLHRRGDAELGPERLRFDKPNVALLGSWSKLFRIAIALMALSPLTTVYAQHASDDPLATANDAFGLTLGLETIGLYGPGGVRGFNPRSAGNVRIDGLYFDQQGALSNRVVEGSTIRIGVSEIGYAFPAPTGIVDYDLRHPGNGTPSATVVASVGPFQRHGLSVDGNLPLISSSLQLPMGASLQTTTMTPPGNYDPVTHPRSRTDAIQRVPADLLNHLAGQIEVPAPMIATLRALYLKRRRTLFEHQRWAMDFLGLIRFEPTDTPGILTVDWNR